MLVSAQPPLPGEIMCVTVSDTLLKLSSSPSAQQQACPEEDPTLPKTQEVCRPRGASLVLCQSGISRGTNPVLSQQQ